MQTPNRIRYCHYNSQNRTSGVMQKTLYRDFQDRDQGGWEVYNMTFLGIGGYVVRMKNIICGIRFYLVNMVW